MATRETVGVPVLAGFDYATDPGLRARMWERWDELRDEFPIFRADFGVDPIWVLTRYDDIHSAFQNYGLYSNECVVVTEPVGTHRWIPELDPPEHGKYRQLLTSWFTPGAVKALEPKIRAWCVELIDRFAAAGTCDFYRDFAHLFPTVIFMNLRGLPVERVNQLMQWADELMHTPSEDDPAGAIRQNATMSIMGMLGGLIAERRAEPKDDIMSALLEARIDGEPLTDSDLLQVTFLLYMAGLDTVAGELGCFFHHLATNPADRRRIAQEPTLVTAAVEEMLRAFSIVTTGRVLTADTELHGCPMKAGDRVLLPTPSANRDNGEFDGARDVNFDRERNRHMAFGAGPHRCLGSYLARAELAIALEEWHARIPEYELDTDQALGFHAAGVAGFDRLPLRWNVSGTACE